MRFELQCLRSPLMIAAGVRQDELQFDVVAMERNLLGD
jgi:hypothetical protein